MPKCVKKFLPKQQRYYIFCGQVNTEYETLGF
jgi:hypothetical protein